MNQNKSSYIVSIIITNYNYESFVEKAISSAFNQTYTNIEIIIIDDGSTDNSWSIIEKYKNRAICLQQSNSGQAAAMNRGFTVSTGSWILFLDADDELLPNAITSCLNILNSDKQISKIQAPLATADEMGKLLGQRVPRQLLAFGDLKSILLHHGPESYVCSPTTGNLWNRDFLLQVFPIPEELFKVSADSYLFTLSPLYGEILRLDSTIGLYRLHGKNSYWQLSGQIQQLRTDIIRYQQRAYILSQHASKFGYASSQRQWKLDNRYFLAKILIFYKLNHRKLSKNFLLACIRSCFVSSIVFWKKLAWAAWFVGLWVAPQPLVPAIAKPFSQLRTRL